MSNNPRKLRLLVKGKEKLDSLLHRRKKPRKEEDNSATAEQNGDLDFEDETPILSQIKDPSQFAASQMTSPRPILPRLNECQTKSQPDRSLMKRPNKSDEHDQQEWNENENANKIAEQVIKSQRRRGVVGTPELQNQSQPAMVFNTSTVTSGHRAVAMQPSASFAPTTFTFSMQNGTPIFSPIHGLGVQMSRDESNHSQIQQAARNTFHQSDPRPQILPKESFESTKLGVGIENVQKATETSLGEANTNLKDHKSVKTSHPSSYEFLAEKMQLPTEADPLRYLRLSAASRPPNPSIDKAQPMAIVSDFVRSEIEAPLPGPELYRDARHKPVMPKHAFINSNPDALEVTKFIYDAGKDVELPRLTKHGDVPAVTSIKQERVPVRAPSGPPMTKVKQGAFGPSINDTLALATGATNLPPHAATKAKLRTVPDTHYTAPDRLISAFDFAKSQLSSTRSRGLKRKRGDTILPPPSYVHQRTNNPDFNIFTKGILCYPELTLLVASHLPVQTLINLYSISKDFHIIVNQRFTTVVLNQLRVKAPCATKCYPWRCYAHLCQTNPSLHAQDRHLGHTGEVVNIRAPGLSALPSRHHSNDGNGNLTKKVPTFRYLRMAIHREKVIHELYAVFAEQGVPLPGCPATYIPQPHEHASLRANQGFATTLHKMWFLFDIPDNGRRVGYMHSVPLFTNTDLLYGLTFIVKLDMILHDPLAGEKRDNMRKLLLSARDGFDTMLRVLKRDAGSGAAGRGSALNNGLDLLRAWARYGLQIYEEGGVDRAMIGGMIPFNLTPEQRAASISLFGIPREEIGLLKREFWGALDTYQRGTNVKASPRRSNLPTNPNVAASANASANVNVNVSNNAHASANAMMNANTNMNANITPHPNPPPTVKRRVIGRPPGYLMRVDQLLLRESIRRRLAMNKQFLRSLLHGYVDPATLTRIPVREYGRRSDVLEEMGEYDVEGLAGGLGTLKVEEGGDDLLDLGEPQSEMGSALMVKRRGLGKREMAERRKGEEIRKDMYAAWRAEVEREQKEKRLRNARKGLLNAKGGGGGGGSWW